ncbi:MAG: BamA/TamA family outer membrane protein, partial [Deltaproteobacteria bacterium]|nr:BamA/TamA family outer membrane protein [Deltaproteobacteria bacterium]
RAASWQARTLRDEPFGPEPLHLDLAGLGDVAIGLAYGRSERYPNSVVAERVRALSLALTAALPELGDDDRALRVDLSGRQSFRLGKHRVLALRGRLGHGLIVPRGQRPYRVVGIGPTDVSALLAGPGGGDFGAVRGLLDAQRDGRKLAGRSLGWGSAELHWPLLDLGRGFDTLPLWLGRLWAVVFVDAAGVLAGDEARLRAVTTTSGVAGSAGVELRLGVDTGYLPLGTLRLGAAAIHGGAEGFASWIRLGY